MQSQGATAWLSVAALFGHYLPAQRSDPLTGLSEGPWPIHIQVNTDDGVEGPEAVVAQVEAAVDSVLGRFADQLTRVEVHLGDENADRSGHADKRCSMEARPAGQQSVAVSHNATTLEAASAGAAQKLARLLESRLGRLNDHKGAPSIRSGGS